MKQLLKNLVPQTVKNWYHLSQALLAIAYFGYPAKKLTVIGVTGTDGKTTTSTMLYHLLHKNNVPVALISTVSAKIGDQEIDTGFHVTSPDPWSLQKLLKQIHDQGFTHVVLEATSHGLDQYRLLGTHIIIGVLTNITHEHLDYHKTYDRYVAAKSKLFNQAEIAILNKDDGSFPLVKKRLNPETKILPYNHKTTSKDILAGIKKAFPQKYNQSNAIAATLVAEYLGIPSTKLKTGFKDFPGVKGRMEQIPNKRGVNAIVDFAHTPNGLENALKSLKRTTKGKLIAVYGSAGLRDQSKRPTMGRIGSQLADEVVLTAEDPRTESVWTIIDEMTSQITQNRGHIHKIPDRKAAIEFAVSLAKKGDTLVILGKGHEKSMCFGKIEYPWSDQEALTAALKA